MHRCKKIERQNKSMLCLAKKKLELDRQRLSQEEQRLEREEERMRKEQALLLAELEQDTRRKLAETLTEMEPSENVLEAGQSRRQPLSELGAHIQSVKSVRLTIWVNNASAEVANQLEVQESRVERETRRVSNGDSFRR